METRLSFEYYKRKELMDNLTIPTISEVKVQTGLPLASVIFEQCHEVLREDLGLKPYLKGPPDILWTSPSDLLIGKVALTPPLTQRHIQALTHEGILELGYEVEQKFLNEMRMEKDQALQERTRYLTALFDMQRADLIDKIQKEADDKYRNEINDLISNYENKICQYLWECSQQIKELEEQLQIEIDSLNYLWQEKLKQEIDDVVKKITDEFLEKMRLQEQILVGIYTKQISSLENKKKCAIEFERTKCKEVILQMRHKLHCQNVADLMYLLCKERRKCKREKTEAEYNYLSHIRRLKNNINRKARTIRNLKKITKQKTKQIQIREKCLIEILKQFQKFIYYALSAAPTQGEFLLNVNKLINFELEDYCLPEEKPPEEIEVPMEEILPNLETEVEEFLHEEEETENLEYSDALPAFYFNDKMYIREDFRDMIDAGIELDQKNSLWNPEVEELLKIFEKIIREKDESTDSDLALKLKSQSSVRFAQSAEKEGSLHGSVTSLEIQTVSPEKTPPATPKKLISVEDDMKVTPPKRSSLVEEELALSPKKGKGKRYSLEEREETEIRTTSPQRCSIVEEELPTTDKKFGVKRYSLEEREETEIRKYSLDSSDDRLRRSPRSSLSSNRRTLEEPFVLTNAHLAPSRISLARDSLILNMGTFERKTIPVNPKMQEKVSFVVEGEELPETSTPTVQYTPKIKEKVSIAIMKNEIPIPDSASNENDFESQGSVTMANKMTSRLVLATDSYEIIKSHIVLDSDHFIPHPAEKEASEHSIEQKINLEGSEIKLIPKPIQHNIRTKFIKRSAKASGAKPKITNKAKVLGNKKSKEHEKDIENFAEERLNSLLNLMKESPSILRLFTSGVQ